MPQVSVPLFGPHARRGRLNLTIRGVVRCAGDASTPRFEVLDARGEATRYAAARLSAARMRVMKRRGSSGLRR